LRVLHLHSGFNAGGKELRAVRLMNLFGPDVAHVIVSAQAGAMDAVMAHTLFAAALRLPPLIHHEDGFNEDEAAGLKPTRNWYRRLALGRAARLVVPSERLEEIALGPWAQPRGRVVRIANGIDTAAYAKQPRADAIPRVIKRKGEKWLGTLAGLRAVKNLPRLVGAFSHLPEDWNLVILGEGPERAAILKLAMDLDIGHRVHLPGFVADPAAAVGLFDLFALSSDSEQFPLSVVEAMAAGLAVAAPAVGDIARMVAPENVPFITPVGREDLLADALIALASDPVLARRLGAANRARARAEYDEAAMLAAYRATYGAALGRASFP
jgi:glycosyltransferase involved in cell wall biosynthesis